MTRVLVKKKNDKDTKGSQRTVGFLELFRYANAWDYVLLTLAVIAAILKAMVFPFAIIMYSELVSMFIDRKISVGTTTETHILPWFGGGRILTNATYEENMTELRNDAKAYGIVMSLNSLLMFLSGIVFVDLFNYVALRMVVRMRRKFFAATIRQDIGWHDVTQDQNFALRITDNMEKIRNGIAENVGHFIQLTGDIIISIVISFVYGWKLTLAICIYIPMIIAINIVVAKYQVKLTVREQNSYAKAGSIAEEVIGAIRTVVAFSGEKVESDRYKQYLEPARVAGKHKGAFSGLSDSVLKAMLFLSSAGAFWYGTHLVLEDRYKENYLKEYTAAVLSIVISGIIVGADHISRTAPFLEAFAVARGSAVPIFDVIDTSSKIDPMSEDGKILNNGLKGNIEFQDVFFRYPSREDAIVLRGFNLSVKEGQTVALIGYSGSGKSTCIQLLQRFYDPIFGSVLMDGVDLRKYNVCWLRSNMAVVGQEPVLFQGSIGENIRHGNPKATQKDVEDAATAAGAHSFIIALPNSYNTLISEKGVQLSGGQRQRIAIARAIIKNPKILLLDEATSALDYHSEKLVQATLDRASKGRTTIVVSHRLSAVCHADHIVFIDKGRVIEEGNHESLMKLGGRYYEMVTAHEYDGEESENQLDELCVELEAKTERKFSTYSEDSAIYDGAPRFSATSMEKNIAQMLARERSDSDYQQQLRSANENDNKTVNSMTKVKSLVKDKDVGKDLNYMRTFLRVVRSAKQDWSLLIMGTICAGIYGCTQPVFAIISAELFASLADTDENRVLQRVGTMAIVSTVTGIVTGIVCFAQTYFFNLAGVWLTTRMRSQTFNAIMRQGAGWFDQQQNSVGALSARLAGDAAGVQSAIGFPLSNIIQALTNFICSVTIAFSYSWELALVCLITSPLMVGSIVFEAKFMAKCAIAEKDVLEETSRLATETIAQIRTVAALRREPALIEAYNKEVERYEAQVKQRLRFRGLINSLGISVMFFGYAITLTYGGFMVADSRIKFEDVLKIANSMLYGLFILAQSLAFTPAFNAAIISATRLYEVIDHQPSIQSPEGCTTKENGFIETKMNAVSQGVSYRDIHFNYPTRQHQRVLRGFSLDVPQGKTVALVGASGSGKSTCVQLLLRYYDPNRGKILINQEDIHHDMKLSTLRHRLGIVSQEPSLFEKSIAENIAYGDTSRTVPTSQIVEAAKMANAHDFITALPAGYETCLGSKGTQLSGGQKQRIAIARALVRNPKILLLDEATSALDLQSERVVQAALDEACSGRTCIVIAHRLATVQNADLICVVQSGRIVEQGNHPQLLAKNGIYAKLYRSQPKTQ